MKALLVLVPILFLMGCSSEWNANPVGTNSFPPDVAPTASLAEAIPSLDEIEPPVPLCETRQTGFLSLRNACHLPVTFSWATDQSVVLLPDSKVVIEVSIGARTVRWQPEGDSFYEELALVDLCETTALQYDPTQACKSQVRN
ncbi:MAG: hypothetical protein H6506_00325 [Calditrichaeota bacterium]|nr:hypothetical protein [Calditrichota bacterium]MCB9391085.1 hypothetical protein [Calditrichota bacterium]